MNTSNVWHYKHKKEYLKEICFTGQFDINNEYGLDHLELIAREINTGCSVSTKYFNMIRVTAGNNRVRIYTQDYGINMHKLATKIPPRVRASMAEELLKQLCETLTDMTNCGLMFVDLSTNNICLDIHDLDNFVTADDWKKLQWAVKIIDGDRNCYESASEDANTTWYFASPETIANNTVNIKSLSWMIAVCVAEFILGFNPVSELMQRNDARPNRNTHHDEWRGYIANTIGDMYCDMFNELSENKNFSSEIPSSVWDVLNMMFHEDGEKRLDFRHVPDILDGKLKLKIDDERLKIFKVVDINNADVPQFAPIVIEEIPLADTGDKQIDCLPIADFCDRTDTFIEALFAKYDYIYHVDCRANVLKVMKNTARKFFRDITSAMEFLDQHMALRDSSEFAVICFLIGGYLFNTIEDRPMITDLVKNKYMYDNLPYLMSYTGFY